jgi:hypothetical protein
MRTKVQNNPGLAKKTGKKNNKICANYSYLFQAKIIIRWKRRYKDNA